MEWEWNLSRMEWEWKLSGWNGKVVPLVWTRPTYPPLKGQV